MNSCQKPT